MLTQIVSLFWFFTCTYAAIVTLYQVPWWLTFTLVMAAIGCAAQWTREITRSLK